MPRLHVLVLVVILFLLTLGLTGSLRQPLTRPGAVVVVVDAGHGDHDSGAVVAGVKEKDVNLAIALHLFALARWEPRLEVVLTRASDRYVELKDRVGLADQVGAALYLSIHANASADKGICGVETWVDSTRRPDDPSFRLAAEVQQALVRATGATDRGVRSQPLYLSRTKLPAVLVEVGYLTCPEERDRLTSSLYQGKVARGILQGILAFLGGP
ncbi:MAG: N-acetylmuramoyl-L-alanine amidase [Candidatus Acetothermia bacterium]|jgi:N-acetylmuramoyl-L-alanine amidase|nr:N-acetylmuramoyl-L-alanine amidase [Candidatus Acetothermia bacterium]